MVSASCRREEVMGFTSLLKYSHCSIGFEIASTDFSLFPAGGQIRWTVEVWQKLWYNISNNEYPLFSERKKERITILE